MRYERFNALRRVDHAGRSGGRIAGHRRSLERDRQRRGWGAVVFGVFRRRTIMSREGGQWSEVRTEVVRLLRRRALGGSAFGFAFLGLNRLATWRAPCFLLRRDVGA